MATLTRKAHTGEPGNPGQFGRTTRSESDVELVAPGPGTLMTESSARELAEQLMAEHGLTADGWSFGFDRADKRLGATHWSPNSITLSRYFVSAATRDEVEQTLLHEIAHAQAGRAAGHGVQWQQRAAVLGYRGGRTSDNPWAQKKLVDALDRWGAELGEHVGLDEMSSGQLLIAANGAIGVIAEAGTHEASLHAVGGRGYRVTEGWLVIETPELRAAVKSGAAQIRARIERQQALLYQLGAR